MNELALFAGAGGGILGGHLLGWRTVCAVEIDKYARRVLLARQRDGCLPKFPIWDDIRTFNGREWAGRIDIISGGFPCQPFSRASRGHKTATDLWPEMLRIINDALPRYVFAENVQKRCIETAAEQLRTLGYRTKAVPLSAKDLGADHIRARYWLLAYANDESELSGTNNAKVEELPELRTRVWKSYPTESGVAHGVANRVDRLKAIGNGQVPLVAATAFRILMNRIEDNIDGSPCGIRKGEK